MIRSLRDGLAVFVLVCMNAAGCGGGTAANGHVAPKITSTAPTTATVGVPFNYTVTASGMTPVTFAIASGPADFMVHPTSGIVTWTPQSQGTVSIEISATNLAGHDIQAFDVEVRGLDGPVFITEPPTEATVAAEYSYDPDVVANGEVSWTSPVAPAGLTIDPTTGAVRWTPFAAQVGAQNVTIRATEIDSGLFTDQAFTVMVQDTGGPAVITSTPPNRVYAGEAWHYDATASGAPTIQWSLVDPSTGPPAVGATIVTIPPEGPAVAVQWNTAGVAPGDYRIALRAYNALGDPSIQEFTVTVDPRPPVPEIDLVTSPPPATIYVGTTYDYDVNLTPQSESLGVVWSLVGATIPAGLAVTIDSHSGVVSFAANASNGEIQYAYTVRAENVLGEGDEATITVDALYPPAMPVLSVTPGTAFTLEVGESFPGASATATGTPTPVLTIAGTLPGFLEFDPSSGLLAASASQPAPEDADIGEHSFDIVATNSEGEDRVTITIRVIAAPPGVDSITPAAGRRQSDVPIIVRGAGFVSAATPVIRIELGAYAETLMTTLIDETTLTATVPVDLARPAGVYDVVVDQGSATTLAKRFTVTAGDGTTLSGSIGADMTLTALDSPYVIATNVRIENGATVTVNPGAVLMFSGDSNLRIDVGANSAGALVADGGEPGVGDQIVFTRFQDVGAPAPSGHYRGLRFGSNIISATTGLRNVIVEFGGRVNADTERGAIEVLSGSAPQIHDSIIRESSNYGLYAQSGAGTDAVDWFSGNQLTSNGRSPMTIGSDDVSTLGADLDLTGNGQDRIFVRGSMVSRANADWRNYGVPYYLNNGLSVRGGTTMSVEAGTEMRFASGRIFQVSTSTEGATLVASGTATAPIRMLGDSGPWGGIRFGKLIQTGTVLRHVRAEDLSAAGNGGLRVDDPANPGDRIAIVENCLFRSNEAGSVGVYLSGNAGVRSFESNVLDARAFSIDAAMAGFSDLLRPSNRYEAPLRVRASTATGADLVWSKPIASDTSTQPIRPSGDLSVTSGSLHIDAGIRIEMPLDGQLNMTDSQLVIDGTSSAPVVFVPVAGASYWDRIRLRGTGSAGVSRIAHAMLESAGSDPGQGAAASRAAIVVEANAGTPATPAVTDTLITSSNGYGMTFADSTHCGGGCNDNTIVGSRFSALRIFANFVGRFGTGNMMAGNNVSGSPGEDGVSVLGDAVDTSATWPSNDVPYVVQGNLEVRRSNPLDPVPVLTIEPGTEVRFAGNWRLRVGFGNDGVLDARGTITEPITFTSNDTIAPVFWRGIEFEQGSSVSMLDWVKVSYGGAAANTGNLNFRSGSMVTLGSVTSTYSQSYAGVISPGSAPIFYGSPSVRTYAFNGQGSNPGTGDPAYDCIVDVAAGTCTQP